MLPLPRTQTTAGYRTERRNAPAATVGSPLNPIELMGAQMPFSRDAEIFGEKEPAEYIYKVVSGAVRTYRILADGRRQIQAFHLAGDVFGFEPGEEHTLSAEAIVDSRILVIKRTAVEALAARDNQVARGLLALMARELQRVQRHVTLLVMTAQERVIALVFVAPVRDSGGADVWRQHRRSADVASGHCGLSRADDRDGVPHV